MGLSRQKLIWVCALAAVVGCSNAGRRTTTGPGADNGGTTGFEPTGEGTAGTVDGGTGGTGTDEGGTGATGGTTEGEVEIPKGPECASDADCPVYLPVCHADGFCVQCDDVADCSEGQICHNWACLACQPGQKQCSANQVVECNDTLTGFNVLETCPNGDLCNQGKCFACYPGTKKCEDQAAYECNETGSEWIAVQNCGDAGLQCHLGVCISACGSDFKANTNAGCGFYAVDLDNAIDTSSGQTVDAWNAQFAVIASNTSETQSATVTVTLPDGTSQIKEVGPLSLETFTLPAIYGQDNTKRSFSAFKVDATQPITVYQFNPLSNTGVFSNDASVLLPADGLGNEYYAMSHRQIADKFRGFVTIVGISEATTPVEITPTAPTLGGGVDLPALAIGQTHTFTVEQGEVVNIESNLDGSDLTGTHIVGDGPLAVFSGHEAAVTSDKCCADHLEQQMVPVKAWGSEYVLTRSMERGLESDWFRVLAAEDGTTIQVNPAVTNPPIQNLNAGMFIEFPADSHFTVKANKPIMVAQFLASSQEVNAGGTALCIEAADCPVGYECFLGNCFPPSCASAADCGSGHTCADGQCQPIGDPALILAVPKEQWRKSYVFLSPNSYAEDYINIVAEEGAGVTLDGAPITDGSFQAIAGTSLRVYRTKVSDGIHKVVSEKPSSVIVYGYDKDVSYGYPGGLGLQALDQ